MKWPLLLLLLLCTVSAEEWSSTVSSSKGWHFVGKFCFNTGEGQLRMRIKHEIKPGKIPLQVLLFDDEQKSWPRVWDNAEAEFKHMRCSDRYSHIKNGANKVVDTWAVVNTADFTISRPVSQKARPHFWYVVLANCDAGGTGSTGSVGFRNVHVSMQMLNSMDSSWQEQFGVNEQGLNTVYVTAVALWTPLMLLWVYSTLKLKSLLQYLHPVVRIQTVSMSLTFISALCKLIHYANFSANGVGVKDLVVLGELLETTGRVGFVFLLLLLANGYGVSASLLRNKRTLLLATGVYCIIANVVVLVQYLTVPAESTEPATYVRVLMYMMCAVTTLVALWFAYTMYQTRTRETQANRRSFYGHLLLLYVPWFLSIPLIVVLVNVLDPWVREKTVETVQFILTSFALMVMTFMMWWTRATEYFQIVNPTPTQLDKYEEL